MAEFCLECWNRINGTNDKKSKYIISKDLDLCEECGKYKKVIVSENRIRVLRFNARYRLPGKIYSLAYKICDHIDCALVRIRKKR